MAKLNLHLHTDYSDGCDSILTMALKAKELDHVALVISDHDYMMDPSSYMKQLAEAEALATELQFPIVCGLEISMWSEEAVLIGRAACKSWLHFRKQHRLKSWDEVYRFNPGLGAIKKVLSPYIYGLCLVHPGAHGDPELYKMFHCHEVMNGGAEWPQDRQELLKQLAPQSKPVRGIDAHSARGYLEDRRCLCNDVEPGEWDEDKVIEWMKMPVAHPNGIGPLSPA